MADRVESLGAVLLGRADAVEHAEVAEALAADPVLREELTSLAALADALRADAPVPVPAGLEARVLAAVAAADEAPVADLAAHRARRAPRPWLAAAAAAVVAGVAGLGAGLALRAEAPAPPRAAAPPVQPGTVERERVELRSADGIISAAARITVVGEGRTVRVRTSSLPIVDNDRELYQLWFVSADGERRVPAGSFHPDSAGATDVVLFAAADPEKLPVLAVTREARDGDQSPTLPDLLRSDR